MRNTALHITREFTKDTNAQLMHEETCILPIKYHQAVHTLQLRQKSQHRKTQYTSLHYDYDNEDILNKLYFTTRIIL